MFLLVLSLDVCSGHCDQSHENLEQSGNCRVVRKVIKHGKS